MSHQMCAVPAAKSEHLGWARRNPCAAVPAVREAMQSLARSIIVGASAACVATSTFACPSLRSAT